MAVPLDSLTPLAVFHRRWALSVLDRVLTRLAEHYRDRGRGDWFAHLMPFLIADGDGSFAQAAQSLGVTEAATRVAVFRLRRRYRDALLEEIRSTVQEPDDPQEEHRALFDAFSAPRHPLRDSTR